MAFALPASPGVFFHAVRALLGHLGPSKVLDGFESVWRMAANAQEERLCQGEVLCQMLTGREKKKQHGQPVNSTWGSN